MTWIKIHELNLLKLQWQATPNFIYKFQIPNNQKLKASSEGKISLASEDGLSIKILAYYGNVDIML